METFGISKSASRTLKNRWELFYLSGRPPAPLIGNYVTQAAALKAAREYANTRLHVRRYKVVTIFTNADLTYKWR